MLKGLLFVAISLASPLMAEETSPRDDFAITLPSDIEAQRIVAEDYVVYSYFKSSDHKKVLEIYDGTAPDFPRHKSGAVQKVVMNGVDGKEHCWSNRGRFGREVLLPLASTHHRLTYAHLFYDSLDKKEKGTADSIIASLIVQP
jgi:hypothetical protein